MTIRRYVSRSGLFIAALLMAGASAEHPVRAAADGFDRFFDTARGYCATAPAGACVDRLWPFADRNRDGRLDLAEVQMLEKDAGAWAQKVDRSRRDPERDTTLVVLMVLKQAGLPKVFDGFDADRDGALTRAELFADFKFDKRPFAKLATDPSAVDWTSFGNRFGPIGVLLASMMRTPPQKGPARPPVR